MAIEITVPRLGWNMEEGIFAGWLKHDGDVVKAGESIFSLESEKATQDIESLDSGILRIPPQAPREGDTLAVGTVIAYLVQPGEAAPFESQTPAGAPRADNERRPVSDRSASASTTNSRQTVEECSRMELAAREATISPRAKRLAAELDVDWTRLRGSGRTGRIREADVRAASVRENESAPFAPGTIQVVRRTIAERMLESHRSTAPVTLTTTADATNLVSLRNQFKASTAPGQVAPGYTVLMAKLTALALRKHPALNARWHEGHVILLEHIHLGIAVDTPAGLYVPVLRDVADLSIQEIAARSHDLIERAKTRKLHREEMQGSTFTITNLGQFGIDAFTPIINFPDCAILGLGRIQRRPAVRDEQIVIRDEMALSLTFDHRVVDGAPAAHFLQLLTQMMDNTGTFLE